MIWISKYILPERATRTVKIRKLAISHCGYTLHRMYSWNAIYKHPLGRSEWRQVGISVVSPLNLIEGNLSVAKYGNNRKYWRRRTLSIDCSTPLPLEKISKQRCSGCKWTWWQARWNSNAVEKQPTADENGDTSKTFAIDLILFHDCWRELCKSSYAASASHLPIVWLSHLSTYFTPLLNATVPCREEWRSLRTVWTRTSQLRQGREVFKHPAIDAMETMSLKEF